MGCIFRNFCVVFFFFVPDTVVDGWKTDFSFDFCVLQLLQRHFVLFKTKKKTYQ